MAMAGHRNPDISYRAVQTLLHLFDVKVVIRRNLKITLTKQNRCSAVKCIFGSLPFLT